MLTLAGALCSSHHSISTDTNCSGIAAKASEKKLNVGPIAAAENSGSLKYRGVVKRFVFQEL